MQITVELPAGRRALIARTARRVARPVYVLVVLLGVAFLLEAWALQGFHPVLRIVVALIGIYLLVMPLFGTRRLLQRVAKRADLPATLVVTDERITLKTSLISVEIAWPLITRIVETGEAYALCRGRILYAVLPKSAFNTQDAMELRALLTARGLVKA